MTVLPDALGALAVAEARRCVGTPWHHGGRLPGVGLDCAGLLVAAYAAAGVDVADPRRYSAVDDETALLASVAGLCARELSFAEPWREGDCLLFRRSGPSPMYHHLGLLTADATFLHAWSTPSVMAVVETPLDEWWSQAVATVYRPQGWGG